VDGVEQVLDHHLGVCHLGLEVFDVHFENLIMEQFNALVDELLLLLFIHCLHFAKCWAINDSLTELGHSFVYLLGVEH